MYMLSKQTLGDSMDNILAILKRQTTLPAYDKKQIRRNLSKKNSNVFIASKEGNKRTSKKELSRLSDALLNFETNIYGFEPHNGQLLYNNPFSILFSFLSFYFYLISLL